MPAVDVPVPLASPAAFAEGPFADLVRGYSPQALQDLMAEATRGCETECKRRLAPFTITETVRAEGIDPDEYTDNASIPLDYAGTIGRSYSLALGAESLVRHFWVNEYPPMYQDMWTFTITKIEIARSYGGTQDLGIGQWQGPENDGHVWVQLGTFLPVGSLIRTTYGGGYTTVPADLARACKFMAASIAVSELDPQESLGHSKADLEAKAVAWLAPYSREA